MLGEGQEKRKQQNLHKKENWAIEVPKLVHALEDLGWNTTTSSYKQIMPKLCEKLEESKYFMKEIENNLWIKFFYFILIWKKHF